MHTVHLPEGGAKNGIKYAAMGIMFSVNDYTQEATEEEQKIIDDFFDQMQWDIDSYDPKVDLVSYGKIMMMFDMNNRWVYKGSVTTPPCATTVYWNVLRRVYPMKQKHLDQFKKQLARGSLTTNYRVTLPIDTQDVHVIYTQENSPVLGGLKAGLGVLCGVTVVLLVLFLCAYNRLQSYYKAHGRKGLHDLANYNS